jgi:hypothetical protein
MHGIQHYENPGFVLPGQQVTWFIPDRIPFTSSPADAQTFQ